MLNNCDHNKKIIVIQILADSVNPVICFCMFFLHKLTYSNVKCTHPSHLSRLQFFILQPTLITTIKTASKMNSRQCDGLHEQSSVQQRTSANVTMHICIISLRLPLTSAPPHRGSWKLNEAESSPSLPSHLPFYNIAIYKTFTGTVSTRCSLFFSLVFACLVLSSLLLNSTCTKGGELRIHQYTGNQRQTLLRYI